MNSPNSLTRIESALHAARDFESFAHGLLRDCLNWPIDRNTRTPDEIGYSWSGDELRFEGMDEKLTAREILLAPRTEQPYGIFLLEFKDERIFDTRGFTTPLRKALRGLVASRRKDPNLRSWKADKILFICTHDYKQYVFAQFWDPFNSGKVSDARLATFGWSPGIPCRTAIQINLPCLVWPDDVAGWNDWRKAFDKEPLTRSFFKQFDAALDLIKADLEKLDKLSSAEAYSKAQLLLERLIFLYFVQNRGWLEQQRNFLHVSFAPHATKPHECSYYSEFLEKLFWSLSIPSGPATLSHRFEGVPFLNGGLFDDDEFDPTPLGRRRNPSLSVRNGTFVRVFKDLLEAFNFTVREDTPLNQEVAVDPEMLGKVFESIVLHAESADPDAVAPDKRKETGSYYTARIVVHFNCREVLYQYLLPRLWSATTPSLPEDHLRQSRRLCTPHERLRRLLELDASDGLDADEMQILRECLSPADGGRLLTILKALRCCDPAVGSGAFMVGLLHELTNLRRLAQTAANGYIDPLRRQGSKWLQETKADIIQNCLFGVDIQQQAIEICMLRLWLSLVVDYDLGVDPFTADRKQFLAALHDISQLPNLEMNFKRGDSLHDHICGVPVMILPGRVHRYQREFDAIHKLAAKLHGAKRSDYKRGLRLQILEHRLDVSTKVLEDELKNLRQSDSLLVGWFGPSQSEAEKRRRLAHEMEQLEEAKKKIEHSHRELTALAARPLDTRFQSRLRKLEGADFDSPFNFAWRIDFPQVFHPSKSASDSPSSSDERERDEGDVGFDIFVGNPPFVTARNPVRRELWRERWQPYCHKKYHLLVPFFPLSFSLLKNVGQLGFIVSNAFMKREFGKPLVELFFPTVNLQKVIDCSGLMFPGHGTPTCLVFGSRAKPESDTPVRIVVTVPGGGDLQTPPEESVLWNDITSHHDLPSYQDERIVVRDIPRPDSQTWPWNLDATSEGTRSLLESSPVRLRTLLAGDVGFLFVLGQAEVFTIDAALARRAGISTDFLRHLVVGDGVRNWGYAHENLVIFPYVLPSVKLVKFPSSSSEAKWFRCFAASLGSRPTFSGSFEEAGRAIYEYHQIPVDKSADPKSLIFTEIATHFHGSYSPSYTACSQQAPVVKLRPKAGDADYCILSAFLNSSSALFWLKQVCFSKGAGEDEERDRYVFAGGKVEQLPVPDRIAAALKGEANPLASRLAELAQACWERGQVLPSLAMKRLFEKQGEAYHDWNSSLPGYITPHEVIGAPFESAEDLLQAYERVVAERERLRAEMIALQEEMDWLVYAAYGLLQEDSAAVGFAEKTASKMKKESKSWLSRLPVRADEPMLDQLEQAWIESGDDRDLEWLNRSVYQNPDRLSLSTDVRLASTETNSLDKDLRPYRLWLKAEGNHDAAIALIPAEWSAERKALWQARLQAIRDNEHIRRIEQPVYKRRWDEQWKVKNRWECGDIAYQAELRDAFDWWLREKAEWWLEHKATDQQATLHNWAKALWRDERVQAAVAVVIGELPPETEGLGIPELVPQAFERLLKDVVDEETVPVGIPFAKPWDEFERNTPGLPKARKIRGKLNVPRERFHLAGKGVYAWAGKQFC